MQNQVEVHLGGKSTFGISPMRGIHGIQGGYPHSLGMNLALVKREGSGALFATLGPSSSWFLPHK